MKSEDNQQNTADDRDDLVVSLQKGGNEIQGNAQQQKGQTDAQHKEKRRKKHFSRVIADIALFINRPVVPCQVRHVQRDQR